MPGREKIAWLLLVMVAAAFAAATLSPARVDTPAPATRISSNDLDDHLTRIEQRLDRLESTRRTAGPATAGEVSATTATSTAARTSAAIPSEHGSPDESASDVSVADAQVVVAQEQSRTAASGIVERAIHAGTWTRRDADEWMVASMGMRAEDRYALVRRLVTEVNSDRLKLDPGATFR